MPTAKKGTKKAATKTSSTTNVTVSGAAQNTSAPPPAAAPGDWRVRIRMYRKWLGDCFLLTFRNSGKDLHVMIDCGALAGTPGAKAKVGEAVDNIVQDTGKQLAALVVTHEHWDHVSGFSDAADSFKGFSQVGEVWAAWTEDPKQTIVKQNQKLRFQAVQSALQNWSASESIDDQQRGEAVAELMAFVGPGGALGAAAQTTSQAMKTALSLGPTRYLTPGQILTDIPGVRVYVFGPPQNLASLHKMMGTVGKDMYGISVTDAQMAIAQAFAAAAGTQAGTMDADRYVPFEPYLHWDEDAWTKTFPDPADAYKQDPVRKIDRDWLNTAAELALQLDSYTNNTSLVLAFELADTKDVLLFVGDAQVGNWQSWSTVKFGNPDLNASGPSVPEVTVADLLARTIFYKVGHHGSHNATLKTGGLEAMTSPRLVAAIPVDENFARTTKHWDMPAPPLYKALQEKTLGRILRSDSDFPTNSAKPAALSDGDWAEFQRDVNTQPRYVEFYVR